MTADDFRLPNARLYWESLCAVADRGEPTIVTAVAKEVRRRGGNVAGFAADIAEWAPLVASERFARYHAEQIAMASERRRLQLAASAVAQEAMATNGTSADAVRAALDAVSGVRRIYNATPDVLGPEEFALMAIERNAAIDAGEVETVLATGLTDLDYALNGGVRPGQLIVIGGRPGMGKSAMLRDIARSFCYQNRGHVLYVSNEMGAADIAARDLASLSGVGLETIIKGRWTTSQRAEITRAESELGFLPMTTYVDGALTSAALRTRALEIHARRTLGAIVVDYLQRMTDPGKSSLERVGHSIRACKSLAIELNVPVIVGSQLNRAGEGVQRRPTLSDLRETGEIEQEADAVLLLYREGYYDASKGGDAEIIIAKQRQGVSGQTVKVAWVGSLATFRNLAR